MNLFLPALFSLAVGAYAQEPPAPSEEVGPVEVGEPVAPAGPHDAAWLAWAEGRKDLAEAMFREIVRADPTDAPAHEHLVTLLLERGALEEAVPVADARLALGDDTTWMRRWLSVVAWRDDRRSEALEVCDRLAARGGADVEVALTCGRLASWTPGRLPDAVGFYQRAIVEDPNEVEAHRGLAQTLAWAGRSREARRVYDDLLSRWPEDVPARVGRAQLARWSGTPGKARRDLRHALEIDPDHAAAWLELSRAELDLGSRGAAQRAVVRAAALAPEDGEAQIVARQIDAASPVAIDVFGTHYREILNDLTRFNLGARVSVPMGWDGRFTFTAHGTRFAQGEASGDRPSLSVEVGQGLGLGMRLSGAYTLHLPLYGVPRHAGGLAFEARGPVGVRVGIRHRQLVDAPTDFSLVAPLEGMGSAGMQLGAILGGIALSEGTVGTAFSPFRGAYVYASGELGVVHDEAAPNLRGSLATGLGTDVIAWFTRASPVLLTVKYNFYLLHYQLVSVSYFSPSAFQVHSPALDLRLVVSDRLVAGVEGLISLRPDVPPGWALSGYARWHITKALRVEARAQRLDDTAFETFSVGLALGLTW